MQFADLCAPRKFVSREENLVFQTLSLSEWVPETVSQAGEANVNRWLVSAVYRLLNPNLIRGVGIINVLKALVSAVRRWIPCNLSIKEYTEIFRIFYKRNVPTLPMWRETLLVCEGCSKRKAQIATGHPESDVKNINVTLRRIDVTIVAAG
jgi:hypothetical protein